ncbi:MAG: hypothetical protein IPO40_18785 [Fibrobacteres bacterium]|nr:hypothetical protein [Fibrobacterota bacterium]
MIVSAILTLNLLLGAKPSTPVEEARPVLVLYETNALTFYPFSESPAFALYDNGEVIFTRKDPQGHGIKYFHEKLQKEEFFDFIRKTEFDTILDESGENKSFSEDTDQPDNYVYRFSSKNVWFYRYYGDLRSTGSPARKRAPQRLIQLFDRLAQYAPLRGLQEWIPDQYELIAQCNEAKGKTAPWPKSLPDLKSPITKKMDETIASLFLTKDQYQAYQAAEATRPDGLKFRISGRSCFLVTRIPFPLENLWMGLPPH